MASMMPAAIKAADLTRFAHRASQLEKFKPVIAYWCEYWIISQILARELHQIDDECLEYTTILMDKLERIKQENANNPAITDDAAGKSTCMSFAQDIFALAEKAVDGNRVTKQTADKFLAAATFFDLQKIWGNPDAETAAKTKYSKWLASEIIKAIREGRDPNDVNPRKKKDPEPLPVLDPNDPEVRMLMDSTPEATEGGAIPRSGGGIASSVVSTVGADIPTPSSHPSSSRYLPPMPKPVTVDDVSDQGEPRLNSAGVSPLEPPTQVSAPTSPLPPNMLSVPDQVSPLAPPDQPEARPAGSYFPSISSPPPSIPSAPPAHPPKVRPTGLIDYYQSTPSQPTSSSTHRSYASSPPPVAPPSAPPQHAHHQQSFGYSSQSSSISLPFHQPHVQNSPAAVPSQAPLRAPDPQHYYTQHQQAQRYTMDETKMAEAQKHAKWAISALNFDDVPTAVKELRVALSQLLEQ